MEWHPESCFLFVCLIFFFWNMLYFIFSHILLLLFFYFTILYWFCHTSTWVCHGYTCVPNPEPASHLPPHTISLGHPSASALSILYPASNLDWQFASYMIVYMFQCHSPKSSHPLPLPQSPKVHSIHLCLFCCLACRVIITIFLNSVYMGAWVYIHTLQESISQSWVSSGSSLVGLMVTSSKRAYVSLTPGDAGEAVPGQLLFWTQSDHCEEHWWWHLRLTLQPCSGS